MVENFRANVNIKIPYLPRHLIHYFEVGSNIEIGVRSLVVSNLPSETKGSRLESGRPANA